MSKYILIEGITEFEEMIEYINNHRDKNYYITSSLMLSLMYSDYQCVAGIIPFYITLRGANEIDIVVYPVYSKVFQESVFRVDGVKSFMGVRELSNDIEYESILFIEENDDDITLSPFIEHEKL